MAATVYLSLGSNIGDREAYLDQAVDSLMNIEGLEIIASSAIYATEPMDMNGESPSFLNQVVMIEYLYRPKELLDELQKLEIEMGRTGKGKRLPRTIDIDILLFDDEIIKTDYLVVPQKNLNKRPYVIIPMLQITPELVDPITKKEYQTFIKQKDYEKVVLYKDHVARNI